MRHTSLLPAALCLLTVCSSVHAAPTAPKRLVGSQAQKADDQTKIEKAINRRGELYLRDIYEAGSTPGKYDDTIKMQLLIISNPDLLSASKEYGIEFDHDKPETETRLALHDHGYLDFDEAQDLSTAIGDMEKMASKMSSENHENTEIHYKTRDDMDFGFYQAGRDQLAYVVISGEDCFLTMESFQSLKVALDQAIGRLKEKGAKSTPSGATTGSVGNTGEARPAKA